MACHRWGEPRFDSDKVLWNYFDAHVYDSNFGYSSVKFVVTSDRVDLELLEWLADTLNDLYGVALVRWGVCGPRTIVSLAVDDDSSEVHVPATENGASQILDAACDLVATFGPNDQRLLWLPWLAAARQGLLDDDPVPAAVRELIVEAQESLRARHLTKA